MASIWKLEYFRIGVCEYYFFSYIRRIILKVTELRRLERINEFNRPEMAYLMGGYLLGDWINRAEKVINKGLILNKKFFFSKIGRL